MECRRALFRSISRIPRPQSRIYPMTIEHIPVLHEEVVLSFMEQPRLPLKFFEGTFGRGGHTRLLLTKFPKAKVVSFDRDLDAIEYANVQFANEISTGRLQVIHDDFKNLA